MVAYNIEIDFNIRNYMLHTICCETCGKTYTTCRAKGQKPPRFCGIKCWATKKKKSKCINCSKEFLYWPSTRNNAKYCSRSCKSFVVATNTAKKQKEKINNLTNEQRLSLMKDYFNKKVIKKDGCWDWIGYKKRGYPKFHIWGKTHQAHRASYMIHIGKIPEGYLVCHKCDNPICTNPEHLFLGTFLDNNRDKISKGRDKPPRGEKARASVLTAEQVLEIRRLLSLDIKQKRIAKDFNVTISTVSDINKKRTWKHI